jgi:RNA polymerase sigma-70 factor, ECF subfamily
VSIGSVPTSSAEFGDAVATFRPFLLRLALLQLHDKAAAEDVVQDTLLAAFEGQARFEGRSSLKTWLLSILRHKTLDALRDRKRTRPIAVMAADDDDEYDLEPFDALFDANNCWAQPKDAWTDPETVAERTAFFQVLDACLTRLPPRTSRAFLMREWLEADPDEICQQLGVTPANLRILLYRARMQLRVCLDLKWERGP